MAKPHHNAKYIHLLADGGTIQMDTALGWKDWDWANSNDVHALFLRKDVRFRAKPMVTIGKFEVPEPVSQLNAGENYFYVDLAMPAMVSQGTYPAKEKNRRKHDLLLARKICHLTASDAATHAHALIDSFDVEASDDLPF